MFTAVVSAIHEDTGQIQATILANGRVIDNMKPFSVGHSAGLYYMPSVGDLVLIDTEDSFVAFVVSTTVQSPAFTASTQPSLRQGELLLIGKAGQMIKLNNFGDIVLLPGPAGKIFTGSVSANDVQGQLFTGKAVVRDGDTATGTDSRGDTVTVVIHATSKKVFAG